MRFPVADGGPTLVFLALGSNQGDRRKYLRDGLQSLRDSGVVVERVSSIVETPPVGFREQPHFLNLVMRGRTSLAPPDLLRVIQAVEEGAGRERPFPNAPRTLDIDIVFFGSRIIRVPGLTVPHPAWKGRSFVSVPLAEVGGSFVDPESGWRVSEVVEQWPMEPGDIHFVEGALAL